MSKNPLVPSHNFLGLNGKTNSSKKSHSFYTGKGAEPMPYLIWVDDYCSDKDELETERKDNPQFLKSLRQNIRK